jgi:hypothetical protein
MLVGRSRVARVLVFVTRLSACLAVAGCKGSEDVPPVPDPGPACSDSFVITSSQEWDAFLRLGCAAVGRDLTISAKDIPSLNGGTTLRSVAGALWMEGNSKLESLSFPALESVGYLGIRDQPALTTVDLPVLMTARGLEFRANGALTTLDLPALRSVDDVRSCTQVGPPDHDFRPWACGGGLELMANPLLANVRLPSLQTVGGLFASDNASLAEVALPALGFADSVEVIGNPALESLDLPLLVEVHSIRTCYGAEPPITACVAGFLVEGNPNLAHLDIASLATAGTLRVAETLIGSFELPVLASVASVSLEGNRSMGTVLLPGITTPTPSVAISGNATLRTIVLPLKGAWTLSFEGNPALTALDLSDLGSVNSLIVSFNPALPGLVLPRLTTAQAIYAWSNDAMTAIRVPVLESAFVVSLTANPSLAEVWLPALASLGALEVIDNPVLTGLGLEVLSPSTLRWRILVTGNRSLPECDVLTLVAGARAADSTGPALVFGNDSTEPCTASPVCPGRLRVESLLDWSAFVDRACTEVAGDLLFAGSELTLLDLPGLRRVGGSLVVRDTASLAALRLPALVSSGEVQILRNATLPVLRLESLTEANAIWIEGNPGLTTMDLPKLQYLFNLTVIDNPRLPECQAIGLALRLDLLRRTIHGNDTTTACP